MQRLKTRGASSPLQWFVGVGLLLAATGAWADSGVVVAQARTVAVRLEAYAQVGPTAILRLEAAQTGLATGFEVLPGETLAAGAVLGRLSGPEAEALLTRRRGDLAAARAALEAAQRLLAAARRKQAAHLSTTGDVYRAKAALAAARAALEDAASRLRAAKASLTLRAPAAGTVLDVRVAPGERVEPGQTLLTLQPAGALWLRAVFYGAEAAAVRVGMSGRFVPADGAAAVPVQVRTIIGTVGADGGRSVGLVAAGTAPGWRSGEAGTVTLAGEKRTLVAVPTGALVLDAGRWWVLVHTPKGNRQQAVVPGPSRGDTTLIERGLEAGTEVVVENAYLEFHREFSRHYQQPD